MLYDMKKCVFFTCKVSLGHKHAKQSKQGVTALYRPVLSVKQKYKNYTLNENTFIRNFSFHNFELLSLCALRHVKKLFMTCNRCFLTCEPAL